MLQAWKVLFSLTAVFTLVHMMLDFHVTLPLFVAYVAMLVMWTSVCLVGTKKINAHSMISLGTLAQESDV